jgi:hypothetical protein
MLWDQTWAAEKLMTNCLIYGMATPCIHEKVINAAYAVNAKLDSERGLLICNLTTAS